VFKYPVIRLSKFNNAGQTLSSKQRNKMIYFFDVVSAIIHSRSRSTKNILAAETALEELQQKDLDMACYARGSKEMAALSQLLISDRSSLAALTKDVSNRQNKVCKETSSCHLLTLHRA